MALKREMLDSGGHVSTEALQRLVDLMGRGPVVFGALGGLVGGHIHDLHTEHSGGIAAPAGYGGVVAHYANKLVDGIEPPADTAERNAFFGGVAGGAQVDRYRVVDPATTARGAFDASIARGRG